MSKSIIPPIVFFSTIFLGLTSWSFDFSGWEHDSAGYESTVSKAKSDDKPYIVYFHVDWCPWCKKLNENYLSNYDVQSAIRDMQKVEINPEKSPANISIMNSFGAKGFPSFFLVDPKKKTPNSRLSPFGTPEQTPSQFADEIKSTIANVYNNRAYDSVVAKDYEKALSLYEKANEIKRNDEDSLFGLGYSYYMRAMNSKNKDDVEKAKTFYKKVLEINPNHKEARSNLDALK